MSPQSESSQSDFALSFELTQGDYKSFMRSASNRLRTERAPSRFRSKVLLWVGLFFLFFTLARLKLLTWFSYEMGAVAIVSAMLAVFALALILNARANALAPHAGGLVLGRRQVSLDDSGIGISAKDFEARYGWTHVEDLVLSKECLIVFVDRGAGVIIPLRAFQSAEQQKAWVERIYALAQKLPGRPVLGG